MAKFTTFSMKERFHRGKPREEGRKAGSKVPPAIRKAQRRRKKQR